MNVLMKYMITASVLVATTAGCGAAQSGGHRNSESGSPPASGGSYSAEGQPEGWISPSGGSSNNGSSGSNSRGNGSGGSGSGVSTSGSGVSGGSAQPVTSLPTPTGTIGYPGVPCLNGYVWRSAFQRDYVCVVPAVLSPEFQINGDHFNFGQVVLQIRRNDNNALLWTTTVTAASHPGYAGGSLTARTSFPDCSRVLGTVNDAYVIAYDTVSHRWSRSLPLDMSCGSL